MEGAMEFVMERVFAPFFIFICIPAMILGMVVFGWMLLASYFWPQETFTLYSADWRCTASHTQTTTSLLPVGKVLVPQILTSTVCDNWSRR
jgi:hypothetical protein